MPRQSGDFLELYWIAGKLINELELYNLDLMTRWQALGWIFEDDGPETVTEDEVLNLFAIIFETVGRIFSESFGDDDEKLSFLFETIGMLSSHVLSSIRGELMKSRVDGLEGIRRN